MMRYWSKYPPAHIILAAQAGILKEPESELTWETEDINSLFARWGGANENTGGSPFGVQHHVKLPDWVPREADTGPRGQDSP
jgi:hypothetical protein